MADYWECGRLAGKFRGNKDKDARREIAKEYAEAFKKEFDPTDWPNFEDMLPDEYMPDEYFKALESERKKWH